MILFLISDKRTPTTPPIDPDPPSELKGVWYTGNDVVKWRERLQAKNIFYNKSDVKTNSPGIVSTWYQRANELVNNPFIDRFTGPTYYLINNSGSQIPLASTDYIRDFSYPEPQKKGDRIFCAAVLGRLLEGVDDVAANKYKTSARTAILDMFSQNIMQFPSYSSAWPGNGTRWNPAGHHGYQNPMFAYAQFFKNGFKAFDIIKDCKVSGVDLFTSGEKNTVNSVCLDAALYMVNLNNDELDNYLTNRNPATNINLTGYSIIGSDQGPDPSPYRLFDGGPISSRMSRHWNNRSGEQYYFGLHVGIQQNNTFLINSFYVFFKEWIIYSAFPFNGDVFPGEMERGSNASFREHAYSYACIMVGMMWSGARLFDKWLKENPNPAYTPLLEFTTSLGAFGSEGSPKNITKIAKSLLKIANQELKLYWGGELLDGYWAPANWYWTEDTTLAALMNRKLKDSWVKKSYLREYAGNRPYPAGGNGSGAWPTYSGWGGTEYELFFSGFFEGILE
jgi:hypothetical protein